MILMSAGRVLSCFAWVMLGAMSRNELIILVHCPIMLFFNSHKLYLLFSHLHLIILKVFRFGNIVYKMHNTISITGQLYKQTNLMLVVSKYDGHFNIVLKGPTCSPPLAKGLFKNRK